MTTLTDQLDAVLALLSNADGNFYVTRGECEAGEFLRDNADTLRAALRCYEAAKHAKRGVISGNSMRGIEENGVIRSECLSTTIEHSNIEGDKREQVIILPAEVLK